MSLSNHLYDDPYVKTVNGQEKFEKIIVNYGKTSMRSIFIEKLLDLLKEGPAKTNPAEYDDDLTDVTDTIFVNYPNYGTR